MAMIAREAEEFALTAEKSAGRLAKPPVVRDSITPVNPMRAPHAETSEINTSVHGNARGAVEPMTPRLSEETAPTPNIPPEKPIPAPKKGGMSWTTMGMGTGAVLLGAYATNLGGFKNSVDHFANEAGDALGGVAQDGEHLIGSVSDDVADLGKDITGGVGSIAKFVEMLPYVLTVVVLVGGLYYLTSGNSKPSVQQQSIATSAEVAQMRQEYLRNMEVIRPSALQ
jgi:hypothetical protein